MSRPSARRIEEWFGLRPVVARQVWNELDVGRRESEVLGALRKVNKLIGGFGVESVEDVTRENVLIWYVNTGDNYTPTIVWRNDLGSFQATTYTDALQAMERKGYQAY